jgi:hypothetical protein
MRFTPAADKVSTIWSATVFAIIASFRLKGRECHRRLGERPDAATIENRRHYP